MSESARQILRERMQSELAASNLDDRAFALLLGISHPELYKILRGEANPKLATLERIASGLGTEVWELLRPPEP